MSEAFILAGHVTNIASTRRHRHPILDVAEEDVVWIVFAYLFEASGITFGKDQPPKILGGKHQLVMLFAIV